MNWIITQNWALVICKIIWKNYIIFRSVFLLCNLPICCVTTSFWQKCCPFPLTVSHCHHLNPILSSIWVKSLAHYPCCLLSTSYRFARLCLKKIENPNLRSNFINSWNCKLSKTFLSCNASFNLCSKTLLIINTPLWLVRNLNFTYIFFRWALFNQRSTDNRDKNSQHAA